MSSTKAMRAFNNPKVREKLAYLKANWKNLSKDELTRLIDELGALGCPTTLIASEMGMKESAIRYYKTPTKRVAGRAELPNPEAARSTEKLRLKSLEIEPDEMPDGTSPIWTRQQKTKEAAKRYLETFCSQSSHFIHAIDMVQQRCDQAQYLGDLPPAAPQSVEPDTVFAGFRPGHLECDPGAPFEHLSEGLLSLMPLSPERDQLLADLRSEYVHT